MAYNVFTGWTLFPIVSLTYDVHFINNYFAESIDVENLWGLNSIQISVIIDDFYKLLSFINFHISNFMQHPWAPNLIALISILVTISIIPIRGRIDRINKTRSFSTLVLREIKRNQEKTDISLSNLTVLNELSELNYRNMTEQGFGAYLKTETQERLSILYENIAMYNRTIRQFNQLKENTLSYYGNDKFRRMSIISGKYNELIDFLRAELKKCYQYSLIDLEDEENNAYSFFPYHYQVSIYFKKLLILKDISILLYRFSYYIKRRNA